MNNIIISPMFYADYINALQKIALDMHEHAEVIITMHSRALADAIAKEAQRDKEK